MYMMNNVNISDRVNVDRYQCLREMNNGTALLRG